MSLFQNTGDSLSEFLKNINKTWIFITKGDFISVFAYYVLINKKFEISEDTKKSGYLSPVVFRNEVAESSKITPINSVPFDEPWS